MKEKRFHGKIGEEYELFKLVCPHFDELEGTIGKTIRKEFRNRSFSEITVLEIGCGPGYTTSIILNSDKELKFLQSIMKK